MVFARKFVGTLFNSTHVQHFSTFKKKVALPYPSSASKICYGTSLYFKSESVKGTVISVDPGTTNSCGTVMVAQDVRVPVRYYCSNVVTGEKDLEGEINQLVDQELAVFANLKNNADVRKMVYKLVLERERARSERLEERDRAIKNGEKLDALKGMLGTVGGRGIVDKFFSEHVKPYAVVKDPGTSYTGPEIRSAYENFLKDTKNPVAVALLKYFPNESVRDVAKRYQKLYGKISWYDHTLYEALIKMLTIEQFIDTIQSIPAFLLTKEKYSLEKMIEVFIEFEDDYQT